MGPSSAAVHHASSRPTVISFATDVEGDAQWWSRFVELSEVLRRAPDGSLELPDGAHFVFGGDASDNGQGDLQVLEDLVAMKRRYPDRVHLIMGNRDINKLRLLVELGQAHRDAVPLVEHPGVYWSAATAPRKRLSPEELREDTAVTRLRWILRHTMAADGAFEGRRRELLERSGAAASEAQGELDGHSVCDDDVLRSYEEAVRPGGAHFEYMQRAHLAVQVGPALFVHAGLPRRAQCWTPGWVPGWESAEAAPQEGLPLSEWLAALDAMRDHALAEYAAAAREGCSCSDAWSMRGGYGHPQPGSALLQYCMRDLPGDALQPSVVYNGWLDEQSYLPLMPDTATLEWLRASGVRCVLSGHLPNGDAPLPLRLASDLVAVSADCTYAGHVAWAGAAGPALAPEPGARRGQAVCEVLVAPDGGVSAHGRLADGRSFRMSLQDPAVGRTTADGWRVKGRVAGELLLSRNLGWNFENRLAAEEDVELI